MQVERARMGMHMCAGILALWSLSLVWPGRVCAQPLCQ